MGRPAPHAESLAVAAAAAAAAAFRTLGGGGGGGGGARGEGIAGDCTDVSAGPRQPREGAAGLGVRYDGGRNRGGTDLVGLSSVITSHVTCDTLDYWIRVLYLVFCLLLSVRGGAVKGCHTLMGGKNDYDQRFWVVIT